MAGKGHGRLDLPVLCVCAGPARRGPRNRHRGRFRGPRPLWIACPLAARTRGWRGTRQAERRPGRLGHPGGRRRRPPRRPDATRHLLVGRLAVRPRPPGQPARVPDRALRGRRPAAARRTVRHLHVWDDYDRFRKVPVGIDASWAEHIGRPLSAVPDPWELPRLVGRALQGAAARRPARAWASTWRRSRRPSATERLLPRRRAARRAAPRRDRGRCWRATAPRRSPSTPARSRRPTRWPTPWPTPTSDGAGAGELAPLPVQALLPRLRTRHDHDHGVRRRDDRPAPTPATRAASPT